MAGDLEQSSNRYAVILSELTEPGGWMVWELKTPVLTLLAKR